MGGRGGKGGPGTPRSGPNAPAAPAAPAVPGGKPGSPGGGGGGGGKKPGSPGTSPGGVTNPQGGGKKGGGGPSSTPAPPQKKWYDPVPRHGGKFETDEDYKRQTILVNPRYHEPTIGPKLGDSYENDYKNNCTRTSATWILRKFFGLDVTAGPAPYKDRQGVWHNPTEQRYDLPGHPMDGKVYPDAGDWYTEDIVNKWIDPATGQKRDITEVPGKVPDPTVVGGERIMTDEEWYENLQQMILAAHPEGSGGFMRITGHIFNWEIKNGKVRFIEPQPQPNNPVAPKSSPTEFYFAGQESYDKWDKDFTKYPGTGEWWRGGGLPQGSSNWFMRVDDLEPQKRLFDEGWVYTLTKGERTAPFFEDMILQSYALYPGSVSDRAAFRAGWDQVRRGRKPRIPTGWKGTDREAPYRAGLEYAKGPE